MKLYKQAAPTLALILSVLALCLGGAMATGKLVITGKDIKNGSVKSVDLKNNGVGSADLKNDGVGSADLQNGGVDSVDIGDNQVGPAAVDLPPPVQFTVPAGVSGNVGTGDFSQVLAVGTFAKVQPESSLEATWAGTIAPGEATNCAYQLRIDGRPSSGGGGEVVAINGNENVSTTTIFTGLPAGPHEVQVWAKAVAYAGGGTPSCKIGVFGVASVFVVSERVQ